MSPRERESDLGKTLELPCYVNALHYSYKERDPVLVAICVADQRIAAFINREVLTIDKKQSKGYGLTGTVESRLITEDEESCTVEVMHAGQPKTIEVPKDWLTEEMKRREEEKSLPKREEK